MFTDKNVPPPPGYKIDEATGTLHISLGQDGYNTDQRIVTGFESASDVPWLTTEAKANYTKVVVEESAGNKKLAPQTMAYWFQGASNIVSINLDNLDASKVTSMNSTFYGCTALESLDLSNLNTIALTDMKSTFRSTDSLATLTLGGNFTTENVTTMDGLFAGVDATETKSTTATNIVGMNESFHTGNVTTFAGAFSNHKFTALDFSSFTISQNIINNGFVSMFLGLSLPEGSTLNVESFSGKIGNLTNMFGALDGVTSIKFGQGFDTSAAKTMRGAFGEFKGTTLDLSSFSNASTIYISLQSMFYNCSNLTTIYVNKDLWVNGKDYSGSPYAFAGCKNLVGCNGDGTLISEFDEDETIGDLAHIPYKDDSGIVHRG